MIIRPAQPIATQNKISTDRRAIFVSLSNESGEVDLLLAQRNQRFGQLRTIYIDTSAQDDTGNGCVIETDIGQNITVLANTQGYYTVFVPFVSKLKISSNETATVLLLDFDVSPNFWDTKKKTSGAGTWSFIDFPGRTYIGAIEQAIFSFTIPANTLSLASYVDLFFSGFFTNNTGASDGLTWSFYLNDDAANQVGDTSAAYASGVIHHPFHFILKLYYGVAEDFNKFNIAGNYCIGRAQVLSEGFGFGDMAVQMTTTQGTVAPFMGQLSPFDPTIDNTFTCAIELGSSLSSMYLQLFSVLAKQVN